MGPLTTGVKILLIANVIFFAFTELVFNPPPPNESPMYEWFGLFFPGNDLFRPWQFVTTMFMHGGIVHIAFNMFALASFGSVLEYRWGLRRFVTFFFLAGIGASAIYTIEHVIAYGSYYNKLIEAGSTPHSIRNFLELGPNAINFATGNLRELAQIYHSSAVGASGAVYGILVAFGILYPNTKLILIFLPVPIAAKYFIPGLLAFDLFSGVTGFSIFGGGIAHFAHIGGALIGFLLMMFWRGINPSMEKPPTMEGSTT